ncbi:MAG TPA: tetratricopeptide repeat protein [Steroidobacteraceae bacterium]|nr:tetratricopeptide repeat protein [Steroidobacteraceae bacterium]
MIAIPRLAGLLAVTLLTASLALVSGCGGADARRASHIARGQQYLAAGRLDKARIEFANALQIAPNDAEARYLSGRVAERLGDVRTAVAMYQGAMDVDPNHPQARARLARLYVLAGINDKALYLIGPGLKEHPDDPELLTVRAAVRSRSQDNAGALADAERAVKLAPANEDAVLLLADLYRISGQMGRAIELLKSTLERSPRSIDLRQGLARLYLADGDTKPAEEQLLEAVQLSPRELPLRLQLASFYMGQKRYDDAEQALRAALAALPESEEAKRLYVDFLITYRSREQGERALRDLIAHEPRNLDLRLALGALQQRHGATPQALATYRTIVDADPNGAKGVAARDRIAAIDATQGRYSEALPLLEQALKYNPRDSDALTLRGNIELRQGDAVAAIADLRTVLRDQPQTLPVLRALTRAYLANHQPVLAEEALRSALTAAPHDVAVRVDLGELLTRTQRAPQAATLLEETVTAAPDASGTAARAALVAAYLAVPDLPAARTAAEDLKTLRPDLPIGSYLAGLVALEQKRPDDAQREFAHALQVQPSATDALTALARLQFQRGQHAQAIALVRNAVPPGPDGAAARNLLGELYLADRNYPQAVTVLEEAVRLSPKWWLPYRNLAMAKFGLQDEPGGLAAYEAGVKATEEPALVVALAELYVRKGRFEDAIRQYEVLHERSPHLEVAANNLAMLLVTYRKDQASLDRARDLTAGFANSEVGALLDTHGWVMLKRGEVLEALSALQRASAEAPDSRVILYHLGMAQLKAGQADKARASLEAALAGGASFTGTEEARLALAQIKGRTG